MLDIVGQINKEQARKTIIRAAVAGAIACLVVIESDLPSIFAAATPVSVVIGFVVVQARKYLESGHNVGGS